MTKLGASTRQDNGKQSEHSEYKLCENASFSFRGDVFIARPPTEQGSLELPTRLLPLIWHFQDWKPLFSAFMTSDGDGKIDYAETFAVVRDLLAVGILVPKLTNEECDRSSTELSRGAEIWSRWGNSLAYYLNSRTLEEQPYYTADELEAELVEKSESKRQPSSFKDYPFQQFYPLDKPLPNSEEEEQPDAFLRVLTSRRTCRAFSREPITRAQLSRLLYFTWGGMTSTKNNLGDVFLKKTSPSGGSLHATEVYPIIMNVEGIDAGIYHYSVRRHGLELISREQPAEWITVACGDQSWISRSAAVFLSTSELYRMAWKYESSRALRIVILDIGHLSQTFCLVATSLGLGSFTTAALRDELFEKKIGLNYFEEAVFLVNGVGNIDHHEGGTERPRPIDIIPGKGTKQQ